MTYFLKGTIVYIIKFGRFPLFRVLLLMTKIKQLILLCQHHQINKLTVTQTNIQNIWSQRCHP